MVLLTGLLHPNDPSGHVDGSLNLKTKMEKLKEIRPLLLATAILGFLVINCPFLYYALIATETYATGMKNGLALVFIGEAFLLLVFLAFIIAKMGWKRPGWVFFVCMSILGSLAFSIPLQLYLMTRTRRWWQCLTAFHILPTRSPGERSHD